MRVDGLGTQSLICSGSHAHLRFDIDDRASALEASRREHTQDVDAVHTAAPPDVPLSEVQTNV